MGNFTKAQKAVLNSIPFGGSAYLSHDHVSGRVSIVDGDKRKVVQRDTLHAIIEHLTRVPSGYSSIVHYQHKGDQP